MTWLLVFLIMLLVVLGMSVGVIMGRQPIAGSCGGLAKLKMARDDCPVCGGDQEVCDQTNADPDKPKDNTPHLGYDVSCR